MLWNVRGLNPKLQIPDFVNYVFLFDIITLTETWANKKDQFVDSFLGYKVFSTWRKKTSKFGRFAGGLCVLIKDKLSPYVKQVQCNLQD